MIMHGKLEGRSVIRVLFVGALGLLGLGLALGAQDEPQKPLMLIDVEEFTGEIVEAGWAWLCVESAFPAYVSGLREAERQARESGRGVWMNAEPTPPWVHRGASTCVDGW
jgi:hypothetical protein